MTATFGRLSTMIEVVKFAIKNLQKLSKTSPKNGTIIRLFY